MAESVNIAQFDLRDDLPLQVVRKLNYNFRKLSSASDGSGKTVISPSGATSYNELTGKPTITEPDLGWSWSGDDRIFGPTGTSTTVVIQGDNDQAGYQDVPFTTTEIDVIIEMAERAGAI